MLFAFLTPLHRQHFPLPGFARCAPPCPAHGCHALASSTRLRGSRLGAPLSPCQTRTWLSLPSASSHCSAVPSAQLLVYRKAAKVKTRKISCSILAGALRCALEWLFSRFYQVAVLNPGSHLTVFLPMSSEYFPLRVWEGVGTWIGNAKLSFSFSFWKACLSGVSSEHQSLW